MNNEVKHDVAGANAPLGYFGKAKLTTKEFAAALNLKQQSIRAGLCRAGHYLNLRPVRLSNGRLLWDAAAVTRLMSGEVA